jgi:cysteinyl-tRNA synthetase
MVLKLYNTLTRKKEIFKPIHKDYVRIYGCGPTVYWYQHIGNLRRYIFEDILIRTLLFNNYKIKHIINVTDVGHLTSDSDEGEDKIEKAAQKEGKSAEEISDYYFNIFKNDLEKLNILMPDKWPKATEHIKEQIELIKKLEKKGYTYRTSEGIYFDTSKFRNYGKFAKLDIKGLKAGTRIDIGEKKNKTDFALWKFSGNPGERQQEWDSPWGVGFPGWHIECSAMSSKYLGETFDIHTGGIDHIPVHHTNEIAQSEAATGKSPWVKYWLHCNYLILKNGKMSKSSGEIIRLKNLEEKGYEPLEFRYLCLLTHYRKKIEFDFELMTSAKTAYKKLKNLISEIKDDKKNNEKYLKEFENAINDDLNTPKAVQVLWKLVKDENAFGKIKTIKKMDEIFGLNLLKKEKAEISEEIKKLIEKRENFRKEKNWKKADELREKIKKSGYVIEDAERGAIVKKL